ncbi:MAG: twin-arginine translocase subunit TatC [Candidatus Saelkia tenebricola]|nr:twin-arginine translocase subunit TatC [Candidatus Saelkia tenebricola]
MSSKFTVSNHLEELRKRVILILIFYIISVGAAYFFVDEVLSFLQRPIGRLIFIMPFELFITRIKLSLFMGFLLLFPFIMLQVRLYVLPALDKQSRALLGLLLLCSIILFYSGIIIAYTLFLPSVLRVLLMFATNELVAMITVSRYVSFISVFLLCFGFISLIPIGVLFVTKSGLVEMKFLKSQRKYIWLFSFIIAAILSPPDAITQILVAVPVICLFELSILISGISRYNKKINLNSEV